MINLVKPEKHYIPDYGDILWGKIAEYLLPKDETKLLVEGIANKQVISLGWLTPNVFDALKKLEIDTSIFKSSQYECPYLGYKHYGVVPYCLIGDDLSGYEKYFSNFQEWIVDYSWMKQERIDQSTRKPHVFEKILLGAGYTTGTLTYDGSGSIIRSSVELDDGNNLLVFVWEWYNK